MFAGQAVLPLPFHISLGRPRSFGLWDIISVIYFKEKKQDDSELARFSSFSSGSANDGFYDDIWARITEAGFHWFTKSEMKMREGSKGRRDGTDSQSPNTHTHTHTYTQHARKVV